MDYVFPVVLIVAIIIIGLRFVCWKFTRAPQMLQEWALQQGVEIFQSDHRLLFCGPYAMTSRGSVVYYVRVKERDGSERTGWVKCTFGLWPLTKEQAEVTWE